MSFLRKGERLQLTTTDIDRYYIFCTKTNEPATSALKVKRNNHSIHGSFHTFLRLTSVNSLLFLHPHFWQFIPYRYYKFPQVFQVLKKYIQSNSGIGTHPWFIPRSTAICAFATKLMVRGMGRMHRCIKSYVYNIIWSMVVWDSISRREGTSQSCVNIKGQYAWLFCSHNMKWIHCIIDFFMLNGGLFIWFIIYVYCASLEMTLYCKSE